MRLPWSKSYVVKCPDRSERTVYKNVDDAFPLYIKGWKGKIKNSAGASADSLGIGGVTVESGGAYSTEIHGMLFYMTEMNQNVMINFRTIYMAFVSDPCGSGDFFRRQVENIISEHQRLGIQVRALIELMKHRPDQTVEILNLLKEISGQMGSGMAATAAAIEIAEARQIADGWAGENAS